MGEPGYVLPLGGDRNSELEFVFEAIRIGAGAQDFTPLSHQPELAVAYSVLTAVASEVRGLHVRLNVGTAARHGDDMVKRWRLWVRRTSGTPDSATTDAASPAVTLEYLHAVDALDCH